MTTPIQPDVAVLQKRVADTRTALSGELANLQLGNFGKLGLGVGLAAGGVYGLGNLLKRVMASRRPSRVPQLAIPYPVVPEESPEAVARQKLAEGPSTPIGHWWYTPAAAGVAALTAGLPLWALQKKFQRSETKEKQDELTQAEKEFEAAMLSQYTKPLSTKAASLVSDLDRAFSSLTKCAFEWRNVPGGALGMYLTAAAVAAALSGKMAYKMTKARSPSKLVEKALQSRERMYAGRQPSELFAVPEPRRSMPKPNMAREMAELQQPPATPL